MDTGWRVPGKLISNTWVYGGLGYFIAIDGFSGSPGSSSEKTFETGNYNFMIPSGATIDGIEAQSYMACSSSLSTFSLRFSLSWDDGTSYTSTKTNSVTGTTFVTRTYGGAADDWGHTPWSWNELSDGTFRIKAAASSSSGPDLYLDYMAVKIYYTQTFKPDFMPFFRIRK